VCDARLRTGAGSDPAWRRRLREPVGGPASAPTRSARRRRAGRWSGVARL